MNNLLLAYEYAVNKQLVEESVLEQLQSEGLVEVDEHKGLYKVGGEWVHYFTCKLTPKSDKLIRSKLQED